MSFPDYEIIVRSQLDYDDIGREELNRGAERALTNDVTILTNWNPVYDYLNKLSGPIQKATKFGP